MDTKTSAKPEPVERCTIIIPKEPLRRFTDRVPMKETIIEIRKPFGTGLSGGSIADGNSRIDY